MAEIPVQNEGSFEVGMDEAWKANIKRTYDEMQHESLETIRQTRLQSGNIQAVITQALQNAVETANMVAKRSLDHWDKANILNDNVVGVVCDAAVDQSPPDEGVRQAKTE